MLLQEVVMQVKDLMSPNPACCTPDTSLKDVALMMCDCDCGAIPVVESGNRKKPVGMITDRDIACRAVAQGKDPATTAAGECMSQPLATIRADSSMEACCDAMEAAKVRRMLVVDDKGALCGIVSQADIALRTDEDHTAEVVRECSERTREASLVC
jgi:CBS domain-containing protein